MNLVDPEGRKIEDPDELVMKFKQNIETKIKEIKDNHASLTSIGIDEKKLRQICEVYQAVLDELQFLEKSDDTFKIVNNIKEDGGITSWNDGIILIEIGNKDDYGLIGHELKHAYQFTQGEISFNAINGGGGLLYDIHDEYDAFLRQAYINAGINYEDDFKNYLNVLNKKYSNLNTQRCNIHTKGILEILYEIKDIFRTPK